MISVKKLLKNEVEDIAVRSGVFSPIEIDTLRQVVKSYVKCPKTDYNLVTVRENACLKGFIIFGQTPLTNNNWDLYWLAVDPCFQGQGVGRTLMENLEIQIKSFNLDCPTIRIETSSRNEYEGARRLYVKAGFHLAGRIGHFYALNDDLMIYAKHVV